MFKDEAKMHAKADDCMDAEDKLAGASGRVESRTETESNAAITEFTYCK